MTVAAATTAAAPARAVTALVHSSASAVVGATFRVLARARRARALHPDGSLLAGRAVLEAAGTGQTAGSVPLAGVRTTRAVGRVSRGAGAPRHLPDFLGLAVRLIDAHGPGRHQDLLLTSGLRGRRRVLWPARRVEDAWYTTAVPHETPSGRRVWFGATVCGTHRRVRRAEDDPDHGTGTGGDSCLDAITLSLFALDCTGVPLQVASVELDTPCSEEIRFDPSNSSPLLRPVGVLNALRPAAYRGSRRGWPNGSRDSGDR